VGKYVNTPETAAYHKSNVLYGLNFSKEEIKRKKEAVVVEGQMDLISLFQAGFRNSVAVSGTALTKEQVDLLSRFSQKIILSLDADSAGDLAARRGIVIAQEAGMDISVAMLGEYKDPDEMVRKSPQAFARAVESAVGVWDFYINSSFSKFNSTTGEGKQKISREIVPILASIPDKIVQSHYVNLVAEKLSAPASAVFDEIEKIESKGVFSQKKEELPKKEEKSRRQLLQERFLAIAFQIFPEMITREESKKYLSFHILVRIVDEYLAFVKDGSRFDATAFLNRLPEELRAKFSELMLENLEDLLSDEAKAKKELEVVERELEILKFKEEIVNLKGKIAELEKAGNKEKLKEAEQEFTSLSRALVELEGKEGAGIY
jgi:DNA primase